MKKIAFVVAATSLFAFAPLAARFGPVAASLALVWLAVLTAIFASGAIQSVTIGAGALGALGAGVLASTSPAAAGAVLVAAAFAERTMRVRARTARAVHVLVALVGGGLAGSLSTAYTTASLPLFLVAAVVAGVLAALPLVIEADDPVAHALAEAAEMVSEPARQSLIDGATLRRTTQDLGVFGDRAAAARVRTTWQSLLRLADARTRLERTRPSLPTGAVRVAEELEGPPPPPSASMSVLEMVDRRIADHVSVLARAYSAADSVTAARIGLDDSALKTVESMGESLEDVSRALVEVRSP